MVAFGVYVHALALARVKLWLAVVGGHPWGIPASGTK